MQRIVLDTNIILKYPKLIVPNIPDTLPIISYVVTKELSSNTRFNNEQLLRVMKHASNFNLIEIMGLPEDWKGPEDRFYEVSRLSANDRAIVELAIYLKQRFPNDSVKIATLDKEMVRQAHKFGVEELSEDEIKQLLSEPKKQESAQQASLELEIKKYSFNINRSIIFSFITGTVVAIPLVKFFNPIKSFLITNFNEWASALIVLILGFLFFYWRERKRLSYGVFEFVVGFVVAILPISVSKSNEMILSNIDQNFKILGGLYIMVRGQDNIVKAVKGTKFGIFLQQNFKVGL